MPNPILNNVPGMKHAVPVVIHDAASLPESVFFEGHVALGRPALIKGAVRHWPARQKWRDPAYLKSLCGHYQVLYFPHENHITHGRMMAGSRQMAFAQALDALHAPQTGTASLGLQEDFPELRRDIGRFSFLTRAQPSFFYPPIRYFLYRNAGSAWHYHPFDETLMCQIAGAKQVGLLGVKSPHYGAVRDIFFSEDYYDDPHRFDALKEAGLEFFSATVEEGDALYIPPLWWHGVSTLSDGFGITAAVPWRSPLPVIADTIRRMAAGEMELMGATSLEQLAALKKAAGELGLARELSVALDGGHSIAVPL